MNNAGDIERGIIDNLEKRTRTLVGVYTVVEKTVTMEIDGAALGLVAHYVNGRKFQFFPSKDAAETFLKKLKEEDAIRRAPCHACGYQKHWRGEVYYSIKKQEFDQSNLPTNFQQLLQEPQPVTLPSREVDGSYIDVLKR